MSKPFLKNILIIALILGSVSVSQAQMRDHERKTSDYSGNIIKKEDPSDGANLGNLFNMKMSQSYSVNVGAVAGHVMNVNAFTNSMQFFFNDNLTGQVDISLLHSPFGPSNFYDFNHSSSNKLQVAFDAQLDYQINDKLNLHFEVNRLPGRYGYYPGLDSSPFRSRSFLEY